MREKNTREKENGKECDWAIRYNLDERECIWKFETYNQEL